MTSACPIESISPPIETPSQRQSGSGFIELAQVAGATHVTRAAATSPLKLLTPKTHSKSAWVFTSTYGGGLLGGDSINITIIAEPDTRSLFSTQASTKIYKTIGPQSSQSLDVVVRDRALFVSLPDPVVCFAGARYAQRNQFDLADGAGLVMLDWITSGRRARGERWAFDHYQSRTEITSNGRPIFRESLLLDPADGPLASSSRMGAVDCFATLLLVGDPLQNHSAALASMISAMRAGDHAALLLSASPIENGTVIRIAGADTETVARWIREQLQPINALLGCDPWARKW